MNEEKKPTLPDRLEEAAKYFMIGSWTVAYVMIIYYMLVYR